MCLSTDQRIALEQEYRIYVSRKSAKKHRFHGRDLLERDIMENFLSILGGHLHSPSPAVTASLFAKYYSYLILSGGLYGLIVLEMDLDLSLGNLTLETDDHWDPIFILEKAPSKAGSSLLAERFIQSILAENLRPLFDLLAGHTGIKKQVLWAHAAYAFHYLYDRWMAGASIRNNVLQAIIGQILSEWDELNTPIARIPHPLFADQLLRIRKECCLRKCLPDAQHCTTCPLLNEQQRKESLLAYHKQ